MNNYSQDEARKREHAAYNRAALRSMPYFLAFGAVTFVGIQDGFTASNLIWVIAFHVGIEIVYAALDRDNFLISLGVMVAWCWAIYNWLFLEQDAFTSFMLPLALIYVVAKIPLSISFYREIKSRNRAQRDR